MFSVKTMMRSAGAVGGTLVLLASGASAAHAVPTFTPTGAVVWKASTTNPITMKIGPGTQPWENRTCVPGATAGTGSVANGSARITALNLPAGSLTCTDGTGATFQTMITLLGVASVNNGGGQYGGTAYVGLSIRDAAPLGLVPESPYGIQFPTMFTNGTTGINGANPSAWTIVNRLVSLVRDTKNNPGVVTAVTLSGSFNVGTATSAVTVSG